MKYEFAIPYDAQIGEGLKIISPQSIRIGKTTIIGSNCTCFPFFMTISAVKGDESREGKRRHPLIGNDCVLGCKATVIGDITIGDDVTIMPCAIVTKDIPSHSVVSGINHIQQKN